ncbi:response regulator [Alterileibacterium massiliense]|uniref:response regulator n=1 Tax=Alterileibacterium massiliense TaxID=1870997 RepID=UPI0008DA9427|nr:response regulator transcription factor [Alterileibacterium massiliense]
MIWCVEDDSNIREIELYALKSTGFKARGFDNGKSLLEALKTELPDLIILDIMLPEIDGISLLKKLKSSPETKEIPIIMATAKGMEYDKIQGLDLGADDYLVKPFGVMEMISRVKAVLRRYVKNEPEVTLSIGGLSLSPNEHRVTIDGKEIELTYKEFELLKLFLENQGIAFTRDQLFRMVWESDFCVESRTIDIHIGTLRQKLGKYGQLIKTVRNVGYRLEGSHD